MQHRIFGRSSLLKQIICLSTKPWSSTPGRTQQLMSRLRDTQILYFSPAQHRWDMTFRTGGKKVRPGVTAHVLPPLLLPVNEKYPRLFRAGQARLGRFIDQAAQKQRFHQPLLWCTSPQQVHLLEHLDYGSLVYDCYREWDHLPPQWEGSLARTADLVFTASPGLSDRLSPCSHNIALLPNGANFPLFSTAPTAPPGPPVLGFVGKLTQDLDLAPLLHTAQQRPNWTFLLVGEQIGHNPLLPSLGRLDNVRLLGRCPLVEIPEHLGRCHVLLDLKREERYDSDIIPVRLYEYLSTGKPIVSALWQEQVEQFPDVVYGAYTPAEFLHLCQRALEENPSWVSQRRQGYGRTASWSNRAAEVVRILNTTGLL